MRHYIHWATLREHLETAERLTKRYGGKLPNTQWLLNHKYGAFYRYVLRHPKEFRKYRDTQDRE